MTFIARWSMICLQNTFLEFRGACPLGPIENSRVHAQLHWGHLVYYNLKTHWLLHHVFICSYVLCQYCGIWLFDHLFNEVWPYDIINHVGTTTYAQLYTHKVWVPFPFGKGIGMWNAFSNTFRQVWRFDQCITSGDNIINVILSIL